MSRQAPWIFLRGLMRDARHWGDFPSQFRAVQTGAEIVTLDLPGNGLLYQQQSPADVPAMAAYCRAELQRRGIAPPYRLLAMSLGAMVAVAWADAAPQELQAMVLVNTSLKPYSPFWQRLHPRAYPSVLRMAFTNPDARAAETMLLALTSQHRARTQAVLPDWIRWRQSHPVSRRNALRQLLAAARFQAPSRKPDTALLILTSSADALVDSRCSQRLAAAWAAPLCTHPNAGHDLPLDDGAWVANQVSAWLKAAVNRGPEVDICTTADLPDSPSSGSRSDR